ncbi:hypothetical protein KI688_005941 [Linnemannia hyalina]|uniref:separase n=1 Tax=Linnemannia hyalina TaxID=64524 RepID=A0A9P8BXY5_9FUNG|nr:hypothetical protein KI688_005941 [Linnemannia hyalina]
MADSSDPLEIFIDLLPRHRQYHGQLASDLDRILASKQQTLSSMQPTIPAAHPPRNNHTNFTTTAPGFAKQVKRLVNQSMSTLTQWTKILNATTASDIVSLQPPPDPQPTLIPPSPANTEAAVNAGKSLAHAFQSLSAAGSTKKAISGVSRAASNNIAVASTSLRPSTGRAQHSGPKAGGGAGTAASGANAREGGPSKGTQPAPPTNASDTADSDDLRGSVYRTDQPTYSHVAILVDISFLSVRALEVLECRVSTDLFEIEKARSNLITKIIALGMKKRALKELGILREQLIAGAMAVWDEPDLASRSQQLMSTSKTRLHPTSTLLSAESLQRTYQDLFSFPFPNKVVSDLGAYPSTQSPTFSPSGNINPTQTFILLVQALHNNAVRCWADVRNGSLAHLLYPMLTRKDSPYNWCICIAKSQPKLAQQSLDALFRLLFISAAKTVENNPNRDGHCSAFLLRMLGMRYHAAFKHFSGTNDGSIWDKIMRCGVEYEKSTREGRTQADIIVLVTAYKEIFGFVQELSPIDYTSSHYQSWYTYVAHFASKVDDEATLAFVRSIDPSIQDTRMIDTTPPPLSKSLTPPTHLSSHLTTPVGTNKAYPHTSRSTATQATISPTPMPGLVSVDQVCNHLEVAVEALRKFQDFLPVWQNDSLPVTVSYQVVLVILAVRTLKVLWNAAHPYYQEWYEGDRGTRPDPLKLSCARVDAILFLSRLYLSNIDVAVGQPLPKPMTTYLESAFRTAERMNDRESLPWISNALYNHGGSLLKTNQQKDAVRPLELAIHSYRLFIGDDLLKCVGPTESTPLPRGSMQTSAITDSIAEGRLVLANRYDVLGVCFQSLHQVDLALECFNAGLSILPLEAFRQIDHIALGDMRTSHLPAAKLLNRRARTLLMMTQPCFVSVLKSVPELQARLTQDGQEPYLAGAVQEYEVGLLSVLGVKANQTRLRSLEQIEILKHLTTKVYPGGDRLSHPVRRARVLVRLAMLYQDQADQALRGEALQLVEEAIEILKEWDLKGDGCLEPVRNHYLAMAYTWQGVLERKWDESGSPQKSKPFLIALQLWEVILSGVECFASWEKSDALAGTGRQSGIEKARKQIPDPEQLYGHLQMLADCFGMIDYRVLQVQIYRLMLRLCNGILPTPEEACADSVRIYSRMGQAYLALGYSGKAKTALDHGKAILEEMSRRSDGHVMQREAYPLWLLAHSLYLTSVGHKSQGVAAYNEAQQYSQMYMNEAFSKSASTSRHAPSNGVISRSVEIKVQRAMVVVEASLARSRLLFLKEHLPESIADAMRALRQLNRIISTLATAIEASQQDSTVICQRPMDNPFLIREEPTDRDTPATQATTESSQRRQGIDLLATQRNQWSIFRLLSEVYHQLSQLHLVQGSVQETEYFVKEGQRIARLSRAPRSLGRFLLNQAHLGLLKHEWDESQLILHDLVMDDDNLDSAAGSLEIQDARIQLLHGDLYLATERFDRSLRAYYRTDEILTYLMDKSVIMSLEQLVIREPQTPREKRLVALYQRRGTSRRPSQKSLGADSARGSPGTEKLECASLSEIKATMGYRTSLIFNRMGQRTQARELVEKSREEDPTALTSPEYHLTMAKMLMLELEDAMAKHLMYAMIPESALAIGLFQKTRAQELASSSTSLTEAVDPSESNTVSRLDSHPASPSSSPSVRVTRMSRRRRSQLAFQQPLLQSPFGPHLGITELVQGGKLNLTRQYVDILVEARAHLIGAFQSSFYTCPSHVVVDICSRLTYLAILESCLHVEILKGDFMRGTMPSGERSDRQSDVWKMAARAACSLEMAKAVTQRREMHGLIKQKLHPTLPQEDQAWPKDIVSKDDQHVLLHEPGESQLRLGQELQRHGHKTVPFVGLEKPRPLRLFPAPDTDNDIGWSRGGNVEARENPKMICDRRHNRLGKQAQLNHELLLHPSSTLGNDRPFLEELDRVYDQDAKMMSETADDPLAFQRDLVDILPQNWTVVSLTMDVDRGVLYVNRLRANTMPLVVCLPLNRAQLREGDGDARLDVSFVGEVDGGQDTGRAEPLSYAGAFEELQDIMKESQETLSIASTAVSGHIPATGVPGVTSTTFSSNRRPIELTKEAKTEWWSRRQNLNDRLRFLLSTMEDQWLCGLKGLIQSHNTPSSEENLLDFKKTLEWIMSQASNTVPAPPARNSRSVDRGHTDLEGASIAQIEINVDLCRAILNLGDQPTESELRDLVYFLLDAYLFKNVAAPGSVDASSIGSPRITSPFVEYSEEQFGRVATQIQEALQCYWEAEVAANNNGYDEGAHVILVLDKYLQMFPWESCPVLRDEAVSRVPSIWFLRDRILQQRHLLSRSQLQDSPMPTNKTALESTTLVEHHDWRDLEVDGQKTFYLLNPGKDLKNTEEEFKDYVKAQPGWNGIIGRTPLDMECIQGLSKNDLYISGLLRGSGEFDPTGNAMNYMLAGCPTVVANLWDVTDRDLDRFSKALFTLWGLDDSSGTGNKGTLTSASRDPVWPSTSPMEGSYGDRDYSSVMDTRTRHSLQRPRLSIVEAVKEAREECRLKYLVGAATVVYAFSVLQSKASGREAEKKPVDN